MIASQIRKIVEIILKFEPQMWEKDLLTNLMVSPVHLDTMLSLFITHGKWLKTEAMSPLRIPYESKIKKPATDAQHRQLWSMISTACCWELVSETDAASFIESGQFIEDGGIGPLSFELDFANFINRSGEIEDWMSDRLVHEGYVNKIFSKFLNHHKTPRLLMRSWLRGPRVSESTPFQEKFGMFKAVSMTMNFTGANTVFPDIHTHLTSLGKGDKTSDRILRSAGAFTLAQFELLPTHLYVGRRLFGLADVICTSKFGTPQVPCLDCVQCDGINGGRIPKEIQWVEVDKHIQAHDYFLEFAH